VIAARLQRTKRRRALAWAVTLAGGVGVSIILAFFKPGDIALSFETLALCVAAWILGPLATTQPRPRVARVELRKDAVIVDGRAIQRRRVDGVLVAPAARGASVAIDEDGEVLFLEVDREEDARAIARAVGSPEGAGVVGLSVPARWPGVASRVVSALGAIACVLYVLGARGDFPGGKEVWGSVALSLGVVQSLLFLFGHRIASHLGLVPGGVVIDGRTHVGADVRVIEGERDVRVETPSGGVALPRSSAVTTHALLHVEAATREPEREDDREPDPAPAPTRERSRLGVQEGESVAAWLARLDAWSARPDKAIYRGDLPTADELAGTIADVETPLDERLGARRLLARHPEAVNVRIAVDDAEVQARLDAVAEAEAAAAEERLADLGPMFVARNEHPGLGSNPLKRRKLRNSPP